MRLNDRTRRGSVIRRKTGPALWGALTILSAAVGPVAAQTPILVPKVQNGAGSPAPPVIAVPASAPTQKFTMAVGKSIIVDLPADASEVFVGKPEVANAVVRSARRLYVMAMGKGPTTIFALDKDGRQIATLEINVNSRDIGELAGILKTVMPDNDIRVQAVDDSVILTGTVASAVDAQRALDISSAFTGLHRGWGEWRGLVYRRGVQRVLLGHSGDCRGQIINSLVIRGQDQVTLKVQVVEIRRDIIKQLGVGLTGSWGTWGSGNSSSISSLQSPSLASDPCQLSCPNGKRIGRRRRRRRHVRSQLVPVRRPGL